MGRSTDSAAVPFKVSCIAMVRHTDGAISSESDEFKNFIKKVINNEDEEDEVTYKFNDWEVEDLCQDVRGLYATKLIKNKKSVYVVNESEYACVGEANYCVFALDEDSLNVFLNDYKLLTQEIEAPAAVQQTL